MKKKNKVLLTSMATIAMSTSLLVGGTYALFTSESAVDIAVTSGKVAVSATVKDGAINPGENNMGTAQLTEEGVVAIDRMMPGDEFSFDIEVTNSSNVDAYYRTVVETTEDNGLASALTVSFAKSDSTEIAFMGGYGVDAWKLMNGVEDGEVVETVTVTIKFVSQGDELDNKYNGDFSCKYQVRVEAVQGNAKVENPYDYENGIYYINNEEGMRLMNGLIEANAHNESVGALKFALTDNMDMTGIAWTPLDMHWVNLDGQGYTISNLTCGADATGKSGFASYVGAATIENLTLENVKVAGEQAGIVAGHVEAGTLNVTVKGTNTVTYTDVAHYHEEWSGVGALIGVNVSDRTDWTGITVASGATIAVDYNNMFSAFAKSGNDLCFNSAINATNNGTVTTTGEYYQVLADGIVLDTAGSLGVYNANGLQYLSANGLQGVATYSLRNSGVNVYLMNDIDMEGAEFSAMVVARGASASFDGRGYTISNAKIVSGEGDNTTGQASLFYGFPGSILNVSNLKVKDVTVTADEVNGYAGVIAGYVEGVVNVSGVEVTNATVNGSKSSGALLGFVAAYAQAEASDCSVSEATVKIFETEGEPDGHYAGQLIGRIAGSVKLEGCTADVEVKGNLHEDNEADSIFGNMVTGGTLVEDGEMTAQKLATVTVMTEEELASFNENTEVKIYDTDTEVNLEAVYTFKMAQSYDMALASDYADWFADYYITIDRDIEDNQLGLAGSYEGWQNGTWIAFYAPETEAGVPTGLMASVDATFTYADVANFVKVFNCGVFANGNACAGLTMTVELRLTNPDDPSDIIVVNSTEFTFAE